MVKGEEKKIRNDHLDRNFLEQIKDNEHSTTALIVPVKDRYKVHYILNSMFPTHENTKLYHQAKMLFTIPTFSIVRGIMKNEFNFKRGYTNELPDFEKLKSIFPDAKEGPF